MITICIPALNEEKNIQKAVENTFAAAKAAGNVKLDLCVVDDASTDRTPQILTALKRKYSSLRTIRHEMNQGIGVAVKEVIATAKYPKFMIVPGDNDASPVLLEKMFQHRNKADMILSYYLNKEQRGRFRTALSTIYGMIYMLTFDVFIQYFNGVGIYPTKLLQKIDLQSKRFSITAEINTKLLKSGCTLYELAGAMQTGVEGSKSVRIGNLIEVLDTYLRLVYEIKIAHPEIYQYRAKRVLDR